MFGFNKFVKMKLGERDAVKGREALEASKAAQMEALLGRDTLAAAWSLAAFHAERDEKWLELFFRDRYRKRGKSVEQSHSALALLEAVAMKSEDGARHIIEQAARMPGAGIREVVEPAWAANFMLAAMRVGMESAAEAFVDAAKGDVELMEEAALAGALPDTLIGDPTVEPKESQGGTSTPLVEALMIGCDGVAIRLISASVDLLPSAMSGFAKGAAAALDMHAVDAGFIERRVLALAISLKREDAQLALIKRIRDFPSHSNLKNVFEMATLRAAVAHGQRKTARILLRGALDGLAPRLAEEEVRLCQQEGRELALRTMIKAGMDDEAGMFVEALSRSGGSGKAIMNWRSGENGSPLRLAIALKKDELALAMIAAGADAASKQGVDPQNMAELAAELGSGVVLSAILKREGDRAMELMGGGEKAMELLEKAVKKGRGDVVAALVRAGALLPAIDAGRRMLALSWAEDDPEMMGAVLERLAEMPMRDRPPFLEEMDMGRGRLAQALACGQPGLAIELLKLGASYDKAMSQIGHHPELGDMLIALRSRAAAEALDERERPKSEPGKDVSFNPAAPNIASGLAEKVAKAREKLDGAKKSGLAMSAIPRAIGS